MPIFFKTCFIWAVFMIDLRVHITSLTGLYYLLWLNATDMPFLRNVLNYCCCSYNGLPAYTLISPIY